MLCFVVLFVLVVTVITNVYPQIIANYTHSDGDIVAKRDEKIVTPPLHPQKITLQGREHYYLLPSYITTLQQSTNSSSAFTTKTPSPINGVLIILHTCQQSGLDVFQLPENRIVVYDALQKGLAVLAPTAYDRETKCFSYRDLGQLPHLVEDWTSRHKLQYLPRMGMGESSGGSFLFFVYKELNLRSMAIYNTPQIFLEEDWTATAIPTVLLTMPLDDSVADRMTQHYQKLQRHNISTQLYKVTPRPFTSSLCPSRFPEWSLSFCQQLFASSSTDSLFNADGFVQGSVHQSPSWTKFFQSVEAKYNGEQAATAASLLQPQSIPYATRKAGNGHSWVWAVVEQEVKTCQGYHAMTADYHGEILHFLMTNANITAAAPAT